MLQGNCHLLFNLCIDSEVPAAWRSYIHQSKTTLPLRKNCSHSGQLGHQKASQDAGERGHADACFACCTQWSLPCPSRGRDVLLQQSGKPSSRTVIFVSASLRMLAAWACSSSPAVAVQDFADVPPRGSSWSSQPPSFQLCRGLALPSSDEAADSCSLSQPVHSQALSSSSQRKRSYSVPFSPLSPGYVAVPFPFFPTVSDPHFLKSM